MPNVPRRGRRNAPSSSSSSAKEAFQWASLGGSVASERVRCSNTTAKEPAVLGVLWCSSNAFCACRAPFASTLPITSNYCVSFPQIMYPHSIHLNLLVASRHASWSLLQEHVPKASPSSAIYVLYNIIYLPWPGNAKCQRSGRSNKHFKERVISRFVSRTMGISSATVQSCFRKGNAFFSLRCDLKVYDP